MEPNEMEVWDLGKGMGEWERSRVNPDGKWVRYSDAMQIITALQSQIDGMIKRPILSVETEGGTWWYPVLNGITMAACDSKEGAERIVSQCRKALGMDDAKEGGEG